MKPGPAGRDLVAAVVAGVVAGALFGCGLWILDVGGLATLAERDRDGIALAVMALPLLGLFGISALATFLPDGDFVDPSRRVRSLRPATAAAARRHRRPPPG